MQRYVLKIGSFSKHRFSRFSPRAMLSPINVPASGRPPDLRKVVPKDRPLEILQSSENRRSKLMCGAVSKGVGWGNTLEVL
jgi:hypothetical protein